MMLLPGASRVIKLTPNNTFIPTTVDNIDQLFDLSLLSGSKFAGFRSVANAANKIGIVDNGVSEANKYIDSNFNISTPAGSLWFRGSAQQNRCYYLQAGSSLSKVNNPLVFNDQFNSLGFEETSGSFIDRCGLMNAAAEISSSFQLTSPLGKGGKVSNTKNDFLRLTDVSYIGDRSDITIHLLVKPVNDSTVDSSTFFSYGDLNIYRIGGFLAIQINMTDYSYFLDTLTLGTYHNIDIIFDSTAIVTERIKLFINSEKQTAIFEDHVGTGLIVKGIYKNGFLLAVANGTNLDEISEFRLYNKVLTEIELVLKYNQYFNKTTYWIPTIQPVIQLATSLGSGRWQVIGTGFIPVSTNPTGTIGGVAFTVESASDTELVVVEDEDTPDNDKTISITNSDSNSEVYSFADPLLYNSLSSFKFGF